MDVTPLIKAGTQILQSYAGGKFQVSGQVFDSPILVTPGRVAPWDAARGKTLSDLNAHDFAALKDLPADVILFGCGAKMQLMKPALRSELKAMGLSMDVMDTGAACRTYNVLMAEGRRVLAALLPS